MFMAMFLFTNSDRFSLEKFLWNWIKNLSKGDINCWHNISRRNILNGLRFVLFQLFYTIKLFSKVLFLIKFSIQWFQCEAKNVPSKQQLKGNCVIICIQISVCWTPAIVATGCHMTTHPKLILSIRIIYIHSSPDWLGSFTGEMAPLTSFSIRIRVTSFYWVIVSELLSKMETKLFWNFVYWDHSQIWKT